MVNVDGEDASTALKVYCSCLDMLELQLELSVNSVASSAYSAELIGEELMDDVLDKNPMSQDPIIAQKHWKEDAPARGGLGSYEAVPGDTGKRGSI